ncbi:transcriptional repressor CTCF-like isoform X2 [Argiope bruennichi]|uniref:transcriptional repressor CTCF-like isoform X2 n=1 Tax=Argiope bruennichi TaxID=94029 RepID=UPI002495A351|nr:transcriptional repressor CTCF-like isoform X2 [Argiope bruennichi]
MYFPSSSNWRYSCRLPSILENSLDTQFRHRFQCSLCPYKAASNADLKKHILTHTDNKVHAFKPKKNLKNPERTVIKPAVLRIKSAETQTPEEAMSIIYDETYDCPEPHCSYSTPSRRQIQKHVLVHSDKRPYTCFVCNYTFKRSDSLRQHLLTHSGEKPYACGLCPMHFMHRNSRNRHRLKHTGSANI